MYSRGDRHGDQRRRRQRDTADRQGDVDPDMSATLVDQHLAGAACEQSEVHHDARSDDKADPSLWRSQRRHAPSRFQRPEILHGGVADQPALAK